jgi:NADPH:quinone reductase-like Zn-dependent oxidoreductase
MKAVVYTTYGGPEVLHLEEVEKPAPKGDEVLVHVHATTVTIGDTIMRSLEMPGSRWQRLFGRIYLGIKAPKRTILGMELAGEIEAVGKDVRRFEKGDKVFASTFGVNFGGYAEYKCLPEDGMIATKPANLSYPQEDFTLSAGTDDVVFDAVGKLDSSHGKKVLKKAGIYLNVLTASGRGEKSEELHFVKELAETGKIRPVVDRRYPLEQIVEAHRYVDEGHKRENVVITVYRHDAQTEQP